MTRRWTAARRLCGDKLVRGWLVGIVWLVTLGQDERGVQGAGARTVLDCGLLRIIAVSKQGANLVLFTLLWSFFFYFKSISMDSTNEVALASDAMTSRD